MAYNEALQAFDKDEVPVGAVIACGNKIVARAYNQTELLNDVTAHAEIIAITSASSYLNHKYLNECTLYVTLEPCVMCAGALYWSQIGRIVYAAQDDKRGFMRGRTPQFLSQLSLSQILGNPHPDQQVLDQHHPHHTLPVGPRRVPNPR